MPRGKPYEPEDDAIILAHRATAHIQEALKAAGRPPRTDSAIKERKRVLVANNSAGALAIERQALVRELEMLDARRRLLLDRLLEVTVEVVANALGLDVKDLPPEVKREVEERAVEMAQRDGQTPLKVESVRAD